MGIRLPCSPKERRDKTSVCQSRVIKKGAYMQAALPVPSKMLSTSATFAVQRARSQLPSGRDTRVFQTNSFSHPALFRATQQSPWDIQLGTIQSKRAGCRDARLWERAVALGHREARSASLASRHRRWPRWRRDVTRGLLQKPIAGSRDPLFLLQTQHDSLCGWSTGRRGAQKRSLPVLLHPFCWHGLQ